MLWCSSRNVKHKKKKFSPYHYYILSFPHIQNTHFMVSESAYKWRFGLLFLSPYTQNHSISNFMQQETFHKMCSNSSAKFLFTSSLFLNNKFHLTCWLYLLKAHSSKEKWHDIIITNIQPRETFFSFWNSSTAIQLLLHIHDVVLFEQSYLGYSLWKKVTQKTQRISVYVSTFSFLLS